MSVKKSVTRLTCDETENSMSETPMPPVLSHVGLNNKGRPVSPVTKH